MEPHNEMQRFAAMMRRSAALKLRIADELGEVVAAVVEACTNALRNGNKLLFCGNGGSASDSQHLATELLIRLRSSHERPSLPALALTLDATMLTACGNDYGFDHVFDRALRGLGKPGDILFGLTTSGKSANVINALKAARQIGVTTVGFLGGDGGLAMLECDHVVLVPDRETARIQECHIAIGHAIIQMVEDRLFPELAGSGSARP